MKRRALLGVMGLLAGGLLAVAGRGTAGDDRKADHPHAGHFDACAKACTACLRACESCARHCAHLVAEGKKDYLLTLGTCADCGDICATAAKVAARQGPLAVSVCEGCARACDQCGAACEKFPHDQHMASCAKECRACARACRDMIKHAGPEKPW